MLSAKCRLVWVGAALILTAAGCATPGAPQPPSLQLPRPVQSLSGERKGTRVVLTWTQPTETTDKQNIRHGGVTRICRAIGEFPMAQCREVVKELGPTEMTSQPAASGQKPKVVYEDVLSPQAMRSQQYASYAVEVFNPRGNSAGLSNQVRIPLSPTLAPPNDLRVEVTANGPVLYWSGASRAQLGQQPQGYQFRYRIYRRLPGQPNYGLIGEAQLDGPQYVAADTSFEWEKTYDYKLASVTEVTGAEGHPPTEIEGDDSSIVSVTVHDTFPPARPSGLQAVFSGAGRKPFIDLSWAPNTERDLAGYAVYRREAGQPPVQLNTELAKAPAFRDETVEPGHTYWYSVKAVDVRGNLSESSEETSETVPTEGQR
jgi:hypothetical protein